MKNKFIYCLLALEAFFLTANSFAQTKELYLASKDHLNKITLSLTADGKLTYNVTRRNKTIIADSPLGLSCDDQDFTSALSVVEVSPVQETREQYQLIVANNKSVDHVLEHRSITLKNAQGALMILDLVAGKEGVAFRYRFQDADKHMRSIKDELTGFHITQNSTGWMEPYDKAGPYTPGYEDFYLPVNSGDPVANSRNPAVGWCMPALFNVNDHKSWVLISESGTDGSFPGCHLQPDSKGGIYRIAFAEKDEKYTLPLAEKEHAYPQSTLPWDHAMADYHYRRPGRRYIAVNIDHGSGACLKN